MFNLYRVMVFFWILAGLTWLGGVVSMLTDLLNLSVSYQFDVSFASVSKQNLTKKYDCFVKNDLRYSGETELYFLQFGI